VTKVELENVPSGRDPWVILQQTPGVLLDRVNVGGSESGQQSTYVSKGVFSTQATWNVDGVNITDMGALGASPTYYDFDSFEEMQVSTGGSDVRIQTPGVQLNMVTKRGTNDFKGSGRFFKTSGSLQSDPRIPTEAASYLAHANEIDNVDDYGVEAGGPIKRDRLWVWGAYSNQQINDLTSQAADAASLAAGRFHDDTKLTTRNVKINAQLLSSNSFAWSYQRGDKIKFGRGVGTLVSQPSAWDQDGPTDFYKVEDTQIFGSRFYLTGLLSHIENRFQLIPDNGNRCTTIACGFDTPQAYVDPDGVQRVSSLLYVTKRPSTEYRADASAFAGTGDWSHEMKFGFGYRKVAVHSFTAWPHDAFVFFFDEPGTKGATGGVSLSRPANFVYDLKASDAYIGDTILHGNLTFQAGARFDNQSAAFESGATTANSIIPDILPAISFNAGQVAKAKWNSISPRFAVTYAAGADRRTLLRAAANRYSDQLGGATVYLAAPTNYQYLYYYFQDLNGDKQAQRNELCGVAIDCSKAGLANGIVTSGGVDPARLSVANPVYRYDHNLKAPRTDELLLGIEHELMTDLSIGATATLRKIDDFVGLRYEKTQGKGDFYTRDDYVLAPAPATVTFNGTKYSLPYYIVKDTEPAPFYQVIANLPGYYQMYKGLDLTATKRLSHRWMLRGSVSFNDWTQHVSEETFGDPTKQRNNIVSCSDCNGGAVTQGVQNGRGSKGGVYVNSKWQYNMTGTYQIPVIEATAGFNLFGRQGYPIPYALRKPGEDGVTRYILLGSDVDTYRLKDLQELDLRLAKEIRVSRAGLTLSVDAFNVTNRNTILQRSVRLESSSRGRITEVQAPRVFRLGARLTF
jgi:hypothetical protein